MKEIMFGQEYYNLKTLLLAIILAMVVLVVSYQAEADEQLQGAAVVIKKFNDEFNKNIKEPTFSSHLSGLNKLVKRADSSNDAEERLALLDDMEKYENAKKTMNAEEAAARWFEIAQRFVTFDQISAEKCMATGAANCRRIQKTLHISSLIEILPGPNSWELLKAKLNTALSQQAELPEGIHTISIFIHLLNKDIPSAYRNLDDAEESIKKNNSSNDQAYFSDIFSELRKEIERFEKKDETKNELRQFEEAIKRHSQPGIKSEIISVPDLFAYVDPEEARTMLQSALSQPSMYLIVPVGDRTRALAEELIIMQRGVLTRPQWGLVYSSEIYEIFEKIEREHAPPLKGFLSILSRVLLEDTHNRSTIESELKPRAVSFYLLDNLKNNNLEGAVEYARQLRSKELFSEELWEALKDSGRADLYPIYFEFLQGILLQKPERLFWKQYVTLGLALDRTEECLETIEMALSQNTLSYIEKVGLNEQQIDIFLAQDRIEDALALMLEIVNLSDSGLTKNEKTRLIEEKFDITMKLIKLGQILKREDLLDKGFSWSKTTLDKLHRLTDDGFYPSYKVSRVVELLIGAGRYREAEDLIVTYCLYELGQLDKNSLALKNYTLSGFLSQLTDIYIAAERFNDVALLLDELLIWGKHDLADIDGYQLGIYLNTAKVLQQRGEVEKALEILKAYLLQKSNDDEAYAQLASISGPEIIPWLDTLYEANRFEERPLIWKAFILQKSGKLDEAEAVVRQAMKIDPTDGEQKEGQRIFSYSLLADILAQQGKMEEADFFRNIVKSVHIAEEGDRYNKAGLQKKSLELYSEAMTLFADAYCIQWRLGERLYALGDIEGSRKHYKIAFERMPEQFGQVASFCFGCEGAFDKLHSRSVAEDVFSHLIEVTPDRPQVYFLYGLLRKSQKRNSEAYSFFKKAVELDPEYLDAWEEIVDISDKVYLSQAGRDEIVLKMLLLDPQQKNFSTDLEKVVDIKNLWLTLEKNLRFQMEQPESLYHLKASSAYLDNTENNASQTENYFFDLLYGGMGFEKVLRPGAVMSKLKIVNLMEEIIRLERM